MHHRKHAPFLPFTLSLLLAGGCAESIGFDDEGLELGDDSETSSNDASDDEATSDDTSADSGKVEHQELGGGVVRTTVDASDESAWVMLDLDGPSELAGDAPGWELGFQRFAIIVNGGVSGSEGVEVAWVEGVAFESLVELPEGLSWTSDAADGDDDDSDPDLAFVDWYDYDFTTHLLSPKDRVYLIRKGEGTLFKLQIADYYSEQGTGGFVQFYWAPLG